MEMHGQNSGLILYQKKVSHFAGGRLNIDAVHDYATVHLDQRYAGGFSRTKLVPAIARPLKLVEKGGVVSLPASANADSTLDVLVEAMGRINYGRVPVDRKGICSSVALQGEDGQAQELLDWNTFLLPLDRPFIEALRPTTSPQNRQRPGCFFKLVLKLDRLGDTYIDMRAWTKGVVWVNGHNLGRYWRLGPQTRLYCPAPWLRHGRNEIVIFDLHQTRASALTLERTLA
jgi:beta-galactosidase